VDDVQRQIHGLPLIILVMLGPGHHFLAQRARLTSTLFAPPTFELGSDKDVARRVTTLIDLIALCPLRVLTS
jgi:hypothetical protein